MNRVTVRDLVAKGVLRVEDGNHGNDRPLPHEFVERGVAFVRAADMSSGVVNFASVGKINDDARRRIRKGIGVPGDVLLSHKGTVGRVAVVPADAPDFVCSPQTTFWRALRPEVLQQRYLAYVLQSPDFIGQLDFLKSQTDMAPYVSLTDQRSIEISIPEVGRQEALCDLLGALDDKIAANRSQIKVLDELVRSEHQLASALNGVRRRVSDLARFVNGRNFTKGASGVGRVVVRIAELNSGLGPSTARSTEEAGSDNVCESGDILFAWSGSLTLKRWFRDPALINQHIFKVIPNPATPPWLVFRALESILPYYKEVAANKATTMGHIQRRHLDEFVEIPLGAVEHMDPLHSACWDLEFSMERENLKLAELRDTLLPHLMSGRLTVKAAESIVSDAV